MRQKGNSRERVDAAHTVYTMCQDPALDADPTAKGAAKSIKITIYAKVHPVLPAAVPGSPFPLVELEGLTVRPYVAEGFGRPRLAFSYRAAGVKAVKAGVTSRSAESAA